MVKPVLHCNAPDIEAASSGHSVEARGTVETEEAPEVQKELRDEPEWSIW